MESNAKFPYRHAIVSVSASREVSVSNGEKKSESRIYFGSEFRTIFADNLCFAGDFKDCCVRRLGGICGKPEVAHKWNQNNSLKEGEPTLLLLLPGGRGGFRGGKEFAAVCESEVAGFVSSSK